MWSPDGKKVLMQKTSSEDHSGKNYYGETYLYLFDEQKCNFIEISTYEGPIHNI